MDLQESKSTVSERILPDTALMRNKVSTYQIDLSSLGPGKNSRPEYPPMLTHCFFF